KAGQMVDHFQMRLESGLGRFFRIEFEIIDAANAVQETKLEPLIIAQKPADLHQVGRFDHDKWIQGIELLRLDSPAEFLFEEHNNFRRSHLGPLFFSWDKRPRWSAYQRGPARPLVPRCSYALVGAAFSLLRRANSFCFSIALMGSGSNSS